MLLSMGHKGNHTETKTCIFFLKLYFEFCQKQQLRAIKYLVTELVLWLKLPYTEEIAAIVL